MGRPRIKWYLKDICLSCIELRLEGQYKIRKSVAERTISSKGCMEGPNINPVA
jgi:hypothetical protein